ncbi:winged helix-turn-helix transcriptional regulator [Candidatus Woesearchaeota archaeon]|nr:winged helix-turn-helix transcriptional regulator [Candidatus Woesearchaeota archaeon]
MRKAELVYRELLYQAIEKKSRVLTQAALARTLGVSLSTVNAAVRRLASMGAVEVVPRAMHVVDVKKILYHWASIRSLNRDIIYSTRIEKPVVEIEKSMPDDAVFGAYTAYKFLFRDVPADYSEVYVYGGKSLRQRFPPNKGPPNLFVIEKDAIMENYGKKTTIANTFVDLWNLKEWYAKEFVSAMEVRLHGILE